MSPKITVLLGLGLVAVHSASATSLISNGSFELTPLSGNYQLLNSNDSTTITGWTTTCKGVERFDPFAYDPVLGTAKDGRLALDLAVYTYTGGGIKQTAATTIGQRYTLSFYAGTSTYAGRISPGIIDVTVGSLPVQSFTFSNSNLAIAWTQFTYSFTATQSLTDILFANHQSGNQYFAFLDNVSLVYAPVPEPVTMLLATAALGVAVRRRVRKA